MVSFNNEPICIEVLFVTVFLWASIWGFLDLIAQRMPDDARRAIMYGALFTSASLIIWFTPGLTTCRIL